MNAVGGIGNVEVRQKVFDQLVAAGFTCPAVVHPRAVVEPSAVLEEGVQVFAMTYVSSSARIGFGSLLNAGVVVLARLRARPGGQPEPGGAIGRGRSAGGPCTGGHGRHHQPEPEGGCRSALLATGPP